MTSHESDIIQTSIYAIYYISIQRFNLDQTCKSKHFCIMVKFWELEDGTIYYLF